MTSFASVWSKVEALELKDPLVQLWVFPEVTTKHGSGQPFGDHTVPQLSTVLLILSTRSSASIIDIVQSAMA